MYNNHKEAKKMMERIVYIAEHCPHSQKQLQEFDQQGISYQVVNIEQNKEARQEIKEKYGADRVPVVIENGELKQVGYQGDKG